MWGSFFEGWRRDVDGKNRFSFFESDSEDEFEERVKQNNDRNDIQKLEEAFEEVKKTFYDKKKSLNAKINAFDAFINSPDFQSHIDTIEQPAFMTGAYYFKALAQSRIKTPKALNSALDTLGKIDSPSVGHRIFQAECLEKLNKTQEAKDIFKEVERTLISWPDRRRNYHGTYATWMKRILAFNERHDIVNEATGLTAKDEREGFKLVKSVTPLRSLKKAQAKATSMNLSEGEVEKSRYTISVRNRFDILRK